VTTTGTQLLDLCLVRDALAHHLLERRLDGNEERRPPTSVILSTRRAVRHDQATMALSRNIDEMDKA
jgi:hypothetical protein